MSSGQLSQYASILWNPVVRLYAIATTVYLSAAETAADRVLAGQVLHALVLNVEL